MADYERVLDFWFGKHLDTDKTITHQSPLWWQKDEARDKLIRGKFGNVLVDLVQGDLDNWDRECRGVLARIIVADQFSRNIHRNTPAAFACDGLALELAVRMITTGEDRGLQEIERVFCYMPFEHAEDLAMQDRSVSLFEQLLGEVSPALQSAFSGYLDYALRHREIIARFGRFPHRNRILGRISTTAESEFLQQPGSSF